VGDPVEALSALARHNASTLPATCSVIALTGSSGKTSTKDLLAAVLESAGPTIAPPGSFNNEIGMPLTVLRADASTRFLVLEMGARNLGHIAWLCSIARPSIGIELNVGSAHISEFGDAATIALAKGELVEALPASGTAVLNGDDALVRGMADRTEAGVVYFGDAADCLVRAADVRLDEQGRATFALQVQGAGAVEVSLRVSGRHQVSNALAASAAALSCGVSLDVIATGLSSAEARSPWRMAVSQSAAGTTVINDAYNANPESMAAALRATADIAGDRRVGLVLGEMLELGEVSSQAHRDVGSAAQEMGVAWIVAVDPVAADIAEGVASAGGDSDLVVRSTSVTDAITQALTRRRAGDVVLVKASRAVGLEVAAAALLDDESAAHPGDGGAA